MRHLLILFALLYSATSFAQLSPPAQDTFPWFVNYRLPTRVVGTKAPSSIFVMDSTQTKLRAIPTDSITSYIPRNEIVGYKEYVALLTQTGTDAPVATVIYNDLGAPIVWTRTGVGIYAGTLLGAFPATKTSPNNYPIIIGTNTDATGNRLEMFRGTDNTISIYSYNPSDDSLADIFDSVIVTIRVYN